MRSGQIDQLETILASWLAEHEEGTACVIGHPTRHSSPRVSVLTPELAKGLEFDLVVLVDPAAFGEGLRAATARYVSMTRATPELVVLGEQ